MAIAQAVRAVPVVFIAAPLTVLRLIAASKTVRLCGLLLLGAHLATRGYRPGEGPLSPKMPVKVAPGKGIGGILFKSCEKFRGMTFVMTRSEVDTLAHLLEAVQENKTAIPALNDFLEHFPAGRKYF